MIRLSIGCGGVFTEGLHGRVRSAFRVRLETQLPGMLCVCSDLYILCRNNTRKHAHPSWDGPSFSITLFAIKLGSMMQSEMLRCMLQARSDGVAAQGPPDTDGYPFVVHLLVL